MKNQIINDSYILEELKKKHAHRRWSTILYLFLHLEKKINTWNDICCFSLNFERNEELIPTLNLNHKLK